MSFGSQRREAASARLKVDWNSGRCTVVLEMFVRVWWGMCACVCV